MDKLQSAQLQVVLPGTRTSFRRRVIDAMTDMVGASAAFCFFGKDDVRAYGDATRVVDGSPRAVLGADGTRLSAAFGFDTKSVVAAPRRAYVSAELWPETERAALPYFRDHSAPEGLAHALLLFLHEGGVLFGLAGLERRKAEGEFTVADKRVLEELSPFVVAGARAQLQYDELSREAAALRVLGKISGMVYVVDRDRRRVVWAADREQGIDWEEDVLPIEEQLVDAAEQHLQARGRGDALPTPPRLPAGAVVSVTRLEDDPVFSSARCAAVRVEAPKKPAPMEGLSKRERENRAPAHRRLQRRQRGGHRRVEREHRAHLRAAALREARREQPRGPRPQAHVARAVGHLDRRAVVAAGAASGFVAGPGRRHAGLGRAHEFSPVPVPVPVPVPEVVGTSRIGVAVVSGHGHGHVYGTPIQGHTLVSFAGSAAAPVLPSRDPS